MHPYLSIQQPDTDTATNSNTCFSLSSSPEPSSSFAMRLVIEVEGPQRSTIPMELLTDRGEALGWATRNRRFCGRWSCWKSWGNSRKIRMVRILMTISAFLGTTKSWTSGFGCLGSVRAVLGRTGEVERGTRCAWRQGWESGGSKDGVGRWTEWCIGSSPWVSWQVMGNGLASLAQLGKWKLWTLEPTIFEIRRLKVTYSDRFTNESET